MGSDTWLHDQKKVTQLTLRLRFQIHKMRITIFFERLCREVNEINVSNNLTKCLNAVTAQALWASPIFQHGRIAFSREFQGRTSPVEYNATLYYILFHIYCLFVIPKEMHANSIKFQNRDMEKNPRLT